MRVFSERNFQSQKCVQKKNSPGPDNDMNLNSAQSHTHDNDKERAPVMMKNLVQKIWVLTFVKVLVLPILDLNCGAIVYCRQDEDFDYLIGCDNQHCQIQWFHLSCVNMTMDKVPDGDWFCPDCRQSM